MSAGERSLLFLLVTGALLFGALFHYARAGAPAAYLAAVNGALFLLYGLDKTAALRGWCRTPEALLHVAALAGGSPGALLGQRLFRHKISKRRFMAWQWGIVALQAAAGLFCYTLPSGPAL